MRFLVTLLILTTLCWGDVAVAGTSSTCKGDKQQTITTSSKQVLLPAQGIKPVSIKIKGSKEILDITSSDAWFGIVQGKNTIAAKKSQNISIWFEPNFSTTERRGQIIITGRKSGKREYIPVVQPPYLSQIADAFPARLRTKRYTGEKWAYDGICSPNKNSSMLCVVSTNGYDILCEDNHGAMLSGLGVGDYLLYAVPVKDLKAGEQIDFMCTIAANDDNSPKYWIFEYWDGGRWNAIESELREAKEDPAIKYSLYIKKFDSSHYTTYAQSFILNEPITKGVVKVRLRLLSKGDGRVRIPDATGYEGMWMVRYKEAPAVTDTKKILFIGNSFTYFFGTPFMFKEIARSEGHQVDAIISVKGGQEFSEHLQRERSLEAICRGGFDYAFLQDTSPNAAIYADKGTKYILSESRKINELTLQHSPNCQIVYEHTWACPYGNYRGYGSYERLDYLLEQGSKMLAEQLGGVVVSPIGIGFKMAREQNINLLYRDNRHQNSAGAYMKACINYLFIYKTRFTSTVSDCGLDRDLAKRIRAIAEEVVFGRE